MTFSEPRQENLGTARCFSSQDSYRQVENGSNIHNFASDLEAKNKNEKNENKKYITNARKECFGINKEVLQLFGVCALMHQLCRCCLQHTVTKATTCGFKCSTWKAFSLKFSCHVRNMVAIVPGWVFTKGCRNALWSSSGQELEKQNMSKKRLFKATSWTLKSLNYADDLRTSYPSGDRRTNHDST